MVDIHKPFYTVDKDGRLVVNKNTDNFFEKYKPSGSYSMQKSDTSPIHYRFVGEDNVIDTNKNKVETDWFVVFQTTFMVCLGVLIVIFAGN